MPGMGFGHAGTIVEGREDTAAEKIARLAEVCPVDIYADEHGRLALVGENLDECVLCGLCLQAAPAGTVRVLKLYDEGARLARA